MDDEKQKKVWLTTEQIAERYGFDPYQYVERVSAGANFIQSKLTIKQPGRPGLRRVWLEEDVILVAPRVRKVQEGRQVDAMRLKEEELAKQYTKGLRRKT